MKRRKFIRNAVFATTGLFTLGRFLTTDSFYLKEEKTETGATKMKNQNGLFAHTLDEKFYPKVNSI